MTYKVFIGIPSYDGRICIETAKTLLQCGATPVLLGFRTGSLLACTFNLLVCDALKTDATHICLLHADVGVDAPAWVDKLLEIMRTHKVDVLSGVIPIKNELGITSTALERYPHMRRLTMAEIYSLPETFTPADCKAKFGTDALLFNSGLLCIRLSAVDWTKAYFTITDKIDPGPNGFTASTMPEDWFFSRCIRQQMIPYAVTRAIPIVHVGQKLWDNRVVYGQATDVGSNEAQERFEKSGGGK